MRLGAIVVLAIVVWAGCVEACSCVQVPLEETIEHSEFIFVGKVVTLRDTAITDPARMWHPTMTRFYERIANVQIRRSWKGVPRDTLIAIHQIGDTCTFHFKVGRDYLVYGRMDKCGAIATNICMRTKATRDARSDFRALGRASMPRAASRN